MMYAGDEVYGDDVTSGLDAPGPCACGCDDPTWSPLARFIPGHDARLAARDAQGRFLPVAVIDADAEGRTDVTVR